MDFNDIQNAWNNEKTENIIIPDNLEKIQSANTPLDKIRKNLKIDLIVQIIAVIFTAVYPCIYNFKPQMIVPFYLLFSIYVAICIYYWIKFYFFYKRLNKITLSTKDSLYETYFDIRLNMELYKTYGFALTPFVILQLLGMYYYSDFVKDFNSHVPESGNFHMVVLFLIVIFSIVLMGIGVEFMVKFNFGKYVKEIRKVLDELKEE